MIRKLGGWGGGGATRCEGVRAALSPTETLGWHMGTMSPWGQSDGEGSTTLSPPPLRHPPPPRAALSRLRQCPQPGPVSPSAATRGWGNGGGGAGGDSLPVPNGQPCPQHAATGTMAAGHPDTAPPAPRHLPAPPRRGAAACTRARGQPAPRPWHGGTPGRALPAACGWIWGGWGLGRGGGGAWGALPPPWGAPGCCCTLEGLHSHSGENESARKVSAAPGPSPHGALRPLGAGKGPRRPGVPPPTHPQSQPGCHIGSARLWDGG